MNNFEFEVTSGFVNLSDPCYDNDVWCGEFHVPAINGKWTVELETSDQGDWGTRVKGWKATLVDSHEPTSGKTYDSLGVDSGQFGIFDESIYDSNTSYDDKDKFYGMCCETTTSENRGGTIMNQGFVSKTGFGDGGYVGKGEFAGGKLCAFSVEFISDRED